MKTSKTHRGFSISEFKDRYGASCSIQKSSLGTEDAIWFGIDNVIPRIMAVDAKRIGIETNEVNGWIDYQIPKEVLLSSRMHLTQEMVAELLPTLIRFAKTGEL